MGKVLALCNACLVTSTVDGVWYCCVTTACLD